MTREEPEIATAASPRRLARAVRRLMKVVLAIASLMALAIVSISTLAAHLMSIPERHPVSMRMTPGVLGAEFEEVRFPARGDGVEIAGWFIPSATAKKAVVLVHGKDANRTCEFDPDLADDIPGKFPELAVRLNRNGFAILMIDLRGHGQSGPARFGFGRTERLDVLGAIDWLEAKGFRGGSIGILGVSMGAATAIGAASYDDRVGAVVADSSFAEIASVVELNWTRTTHLPQFFLPFTKLAGKHLFGCDVDAARPVDEIRDLRRPILLIHGDGDPIIPAQHSRTLKDAAADRAELWTVPTETHAAVYLIDAQLYVDKITKFFDSHLEWHERGKEAQQASAPQAEAVGDLD